METHDLKAENEALRKEVAALKGQVRNYLPTLGELVDRLAIVQLKEFLIPDHRAEYTAEIGQIVADVQAILDTEGVAIDAGVIHAVIVLTIMNREIWLNEANWRKGVREGNNLELSHGLNSIRNFCKNKIQDKVGGRKDYKLDSVAAFAQWVPSWGS